MVVAYAWYLYFLKNRDVISEQMKKKNIREVIDAITEREQKWVNRDEKGTDWKGNRKLRNKIWK